MTTNNFSSQQSNNSYQQQSNLNTERQNNTTFQQTTNNNLINQQQIINPYKLYPNTNLSQQQLNSFQKQLQISNFGQIPQNSSILNQPQSVNIQNNQSNVNSQQQHQYSEVVQQTQNSDISKKPKSFSKTKSFIITYNNAKFIVDPISLCNSSLKFKELIQPYIQDYEEMKKFHLEIAGNQFTNRNMNNFLLLCQSQPTDVKNSEMKDICEIAKMFRADNIYNTGLDFIQKNIDQNFFVPDNKYDGSDGITYLQLIDENNSIQNNSSIDKNQEEEDIDESKAYDTNENRETFNPVIYTLRVVNHTFKCPTFKSVLDKSVMFIAKQKYNEIYIAEGNEVHIHKKENHVGHITQNEGEKNNLISLRDMTIKLIYVNTAVLGHYSIDVSFPFEDHTEHWVPKKPKYDQNSNNYYLNFSGFYHHSSLQSARNIILQNQNGNLTYIVRKMDNNIYEIECNKSLDPLIVFSIALSDIVGPYDDPLKTHESYEL